MSTRETEKGSLASAPLSRGYVQVYTLQVCEYFIIITHLKPLKRAMFSTVQPEQFSSAERFTCICSEFLASDYQASVDHCPMSALVLNDNNFHYVCSENMEGLGLC